MYFKKNLLLIKHKFFTARTVENDIKILSEQYKINTYNVKIEKGFLFFIGMIREFFYLIFNSYRYEIFFIWFADYHSLLPVFFSHIFKKKCVINIGGYDADELLIGNPVLIKNKFRKFCAMYSVKNSDKLLPVSNLIKNYLSNFVDESKCETVYNCINVEVFNAKEKYEKKNLVVTVGGGGEFIKEAKRKRLDFFIEIGNEFNKRYPEYNAKFYLIGHNQNSKSYHFLIPFIKSRSVELKPVTSSINELSEYYKAASIYMQLSYYEAFGIAQAEAMLYECIPISYAGGAIPEVVGNAGFIFKDFNKEAYLNTIKDVFDKKHEELRHKVRQRVLEKFTLQARRKKLLGILNNL